MTRTPRLRSHIDNLTGHIDNLTGHVRAWVPAALSRKTTAYVAAGLALAGVAGAAMAGLLGHPDAAADAKRAVSRAVHGHSAPATSAAPAEHALPATRRAPSQGGAATHPAPVRHEETWAAVARFVANTTYPKPSPARLPAQDMLTPVGTSGPQTSLPITPARYANAKTIISQAITKHMGLRSAVIAVATSMQESTLLNLHYGTSDSLGLFQQRPSCGWGTPAQILHPAYAADAFLHALRGYQASNPDWASQPLWEPAQGVQASAFPSAYAKWEAQAAHLVASVAKHMV